jgi:hypothetical protein
MGSGAGAEEAGQRAGDGTPIGLQREREGAVHVEAAAIRLEGRAEGVCPVGRSQPGQLHGAAFGGRDGGHRPAKSGLTITVENEPSRVTETLAPAGATATIPVVMMTAVTSTKTTAGSCSPGCPPELTRTPHEPPADAPHPASCPAPSTATTVARSSARPQIASPVRARPTGSATPASRLHALVSLIAQAEQLLPDAVHDARSQQLTWAQTLF